MSAKNSWLSTNCKLGCQSNVDTLSFYAIWNGANENDNLSYAFQTFAQRLSSNCNSQGAILQKRRWTGTRPRSLCNCSWVCLRCQSWSRWQATAFILPAGTGRDRMWCTICSYDWRCKSSLKAGVVRYVSTYSSFLIQVSKYRFSFCYCCYRWTERLNEEEGVLYIHVRANKWLPLWEKSILLQKNTKNRKKIRTGCNPVNKTPLIATDIPFKCLFVFMLCTCLFHCMWH